VDDGADFVSVLHGRRREQLEEIVGGTEETASGVLRLRALESQGGLRFPVLAVNEAETADLFDGRYGTGQSTLDGIVRATNALLSGRRLVVIGYGSCGRGIALRAKGAGANVIVCEVDPLRALEAAMDGYELLPSIEAAAEGDIFVTVTGSRDVLGAAHFAAMKDGAIVANAGHFDVEIDKAALRRASRSRREVRPLVEEHLLKDGRRLYLLAEGRVVNLASAEGHPSVVMDICFAVQALAIAHIARAGGALEPGVHPVPPGIDREIARLKLDSLGARIDELTEEQAAYLGSWEQAG
jgi:adenosylhomocysteinase